MKAIFNKEVVGGETHAHFSVRLLKPFSFPTRAKKTTEWNKLTKASAVFLESNFRGQIEIEGAPEGIIRKINRMSKCFGKA
jgi:hypothetical protein